MKKFLTKRNIKFLLLILIGTVVLFRPPIDPDFGWHYKYGEYLFQNGKVLKENIFSYTNQDYEWVSSYWIPQILLYLSHNFLGNIVPTIISSFLFSLFLLEILKKNSSDTFVISFVFILEITALTIFVITVRPFYFSTVFLFLLVHILLKENKYKKFLPILFLVWANMHADFLIGLFILGVYSLFNFLIKTDFSKTTPSLKNKEGICSYLSYLIEYFIKIIKNKNTFKIFFGCFWILIISTLVTLINPYGIKLWTTLLKELTQPIKSFVGEWTPIGNGNLNSDHFFIGTITTILAGLALVPYNKNNVKFNFWYKFLIVFFYLFFIKAVYFSRIVIIMSTFSIIQNIKCMKDDICRVYKHVFDSIPSLVSVAFLTFLFIGIFEIFLNNIFMSSSTKEWSKKFKMPYEAVSYLKNNSVDGNMLNDYSWGGYLIWQLPEHKTFIDGRMTAWKINEKYLMEDYQKIYYLTDKNVDLLNNYLNQYDIRWLLTRPENKIVKYLKENRPDEWEVIFEDDVSVILKKIDKF